MADVDGPDDEVDESGVALRSLPARFRYLYDFGDGWEHEVEMLGVGGDGPGCISGSGACPPEDVGGPSGYAHFREVLEDPGHREHDQMRIWAGSWGGFSLAATDLLVRQTAGAVPAPVRLVLDLAAGGVKLTAGGRLPRGFVREVQDRYPRWHLLDRPAAVEDDLPPLTALHGLLRGVGLLRLRNGALSPTQAAGDDTQVIRRLRSWFGPDAGFTSILTGEVLAILATTGACRPDELAARVAPLLGDRWVTGKGEPVNEGHIRTSLNSSAAELIALDLIETATGTWSAGPSALWLLPRATSLARLWSAPESP
jgi:hypothetical protein